MSEADDGLVSNKVQHDAGFWTPERMRDAKPVPMPTAVAPTPTTIADRVKALDALYRRHDSLLNSAAKGEASHAEVEAAWQAYVDLRDADYSALPLV